MPPTAAEKDDTGDEGDEKQQQSATTNTGTTNAASSRPKQRVRKRCGNCEACRREDCGTCFECVRKKKFGGNGESKQACIKRRCRVLEELKRERKRNRAAGIPVEDDDDDILIQEQKRAAKRRRRSNPKRGDGATSGGENNNNNSSNSNEPREKDPLVVKLEEAYPDPPSSMLAVEQIQKAVEQEEKKPHIPSTVANLAEFRYGHACPEPVTEMCAGCKSSNAPVHEDDPDREVVILLCDGPDCPHEYHLECCLPPISEIPDGAYYCIDCDPTGSAKVLNKYLDKHDERRHRELSTNGSNNNSNPFNFLLTLWKEDLEENQDNWTDEKQTVDTTKNSGAAAYQRVPQSELSRLMEIQHHLYPDEWAAGKAYSLDEIGDLLIGKPIRLYCPLDDNYHSGRIVDYRPIPPNMHSLSSVATTTTKRTSKTSTSANNINTTTKTCYPNDDFFANKIEFLVRFIPGSDEYRKTLVTRWIRLEEHSLAVGTHLVWGKFAANEKKKIGGTSGASVHHGSTTPTKTSTSSTTGGGSGGGASVWTPSLLFLRTSRELMPVLHLLQESEGEIIYHPPSVVPSKSSKNGKPPSACTAPIGKMETQPWALAKRIGASNVPTTSEAGGQTVSGSSGSEAYKLLRVLDETRELWDREPSSNHVDQLKYSLVMAEHREQEACRRWRNMKLRNKFHPKGLQARDEYGVGPVVFQNDQPPTKDEEELCPLIRPPGLDRGYLMERLVKRGTIEEATRDTAVGLECWLVP